MAFQIFVSYRRDGGEALACLISERLKQQGFNPFYDVESLRSGKFNNEIFNVIDSCTDVIVVLPQNGLDRCVNEEDWVRKEIAYAINARKNIIPIMMRNFEFPKELPADINEIRNYNGISANMEYFDAAFTKLLSMLKSTTVSFSDKILKMTNDEDLRKDISTCAEMLKTNNSAKLKCDLAKCYEKLHNNELNEEIAKLYMQAAEMNYAPAQNDVGVCYYNGKGVEKNVEKAFNYFRASAEQGNEIAQYNLANRFRYDNEFLAFVFMQRAANAGYKEAYYKLGEYFENGYGTEKDYEKAYYYYEKAWDSTGEDQAYKKLSDRYWRFKKIKDFFTGG